MLTLLFHSYIDWAVLSAFLPVAIVSPLSLILFYKGEPWRIGYCVCYLLSGFEMSSSQGAFLLSKSQLTSPLPPLTRIAWKGKAFRVVSRNYLSSVCYIKVAQINDGWNFKHQAQPKWKLSFCF